MEIFYTEITQDLTGNLLEIAQEEMTKKRKVFYIVPSSMSFEKEKEILERLNKGADAAVFDLIVTRFKQFPYYFDKNDKLSKKVELSPAGMSMLFRKVLKSFEKEEIPLYFGLQNSASFFDLLVHLRAELEKGNLTIDDLPDNEKNKELKLIFHRFEDEISSKYANFSSFKAFIDHAKNGAFDFQLQNVVCLIDGYTRFSAEEELFIDTFHSKVKRFVIGTYAKKLKNDRLEASVYSNALQMMDKFSQKYHVKSKSFDTKNVNQVYSKLTRLIEQDKMFVITDSPIEITDNDEKSFKIWESENQMAEIEAVAKAIRQKIVQGKRYKSFTVLVGNTQQYEIPIKEIFELYDIPYFYAAEEKMSHHPLIVFLESLFAIKSNNYRMDDVINFVKCQLYHPSVFNQDVIDAFEYYVHQNKIQGKKKLTHPFEPSFFSHFDEVEQFRSDLFDEKSPLHDFISGNQAILGKNWVEKLELFFENGQVVQQLNERFQALENEDEHELADRHEQVWNLLLSNLQEFLAVFSDQKMKITEFLDIILAGMRNATYRQIPANVDVVNIKDYELVEPRTNAYVYAIGLSQANFPKNKLNSTLLSDEERAEINSTTKENQFIEQLKLVNYQKSTFTSLSLMNAAMEELTLSVPQIVENVQDDISPDIQLILDHSSPKIRKKIQNSHANKGIEHIGNTRAVIATIGKIEREISENPNKFEQAAFWSSIFRVLTKNNKAFQTILLRLDQDIAPTDLATETVNQVYSKNNYASVSSFERFYNCEFQYFITNTLNLEQFEVIDINSKVVGNFFHEVFEKLLQQKDVTSDNFDARLTSVITDVNATYQHYFVQDATARFTWENLEEILYQTAAVLKKNSATHQLKTKLTESDFGLKTSSLGEFVIDDVHLRGRIDRIDETKAHALGAIDYKSSAHQFKIQEAYDGVSLQFLTYLDVLRKTFSDQKIWGALYLHFQNNAINLSEINQLSEISNVLDKAMSYEGLLLAENSDEISKIEGIKVNKSNIYDSQAFENLLKINEQHYQKANHRLKSGKIAINPVMKRSEGIDPSGNVRGCSYCPLKSICRFEANVHMNQYTREIAQKTTQEINQIVRGQL